MLRAHGLTEQQWRVLRAMAAVTHRLRPMELSQATYISMPSLSRLLKTLEGRQLVERSRHASDMRGAEFELTAAGPPPPGGAPPPSPPTRTQEDTPRIPSPPKT